MKNTRLFLVSAAALCFAGCATDTVNAPPVTAAMLDAAAKQRIAPETLSSGRALYLRRCTECHSLQPLGDYSPARRARILDDMTARAKMNEDEKRGMLAYLRLIPESR